MSSGSAQRLRKARAPVSVGTSSSSGAPVQRGKDNKTSDPAKLAADNSETPAAINSNSTAATVQQGGPETPIEATGVYADAKYTAMLTSVIGCDVVVLTTGCAQFQGILDSVSSENTFVLRMATRVDPQHPQRIDVASLKDTLIFHCDKVVTASASGVDLEYACRAPSAGFQTDAGIAEQAERRGGGLERQLQPWVADEAPATGSAAQLVSLDSANGWDAQDMFLTNERKYGVRSTYDHSMAGYTTQLAPASAHLESQAARIASEIEASSDPARHRVNGDEEEAFSAVSRAESGGVDRYVPPGRRSLAASAPVPSARHASHHQPQHYRGAGGRSRGGAGQRAAHHRSSHHHHPQQQNYHGRYDDSPRHAAARDNHRPRQQQQAAPSPPTTHAAQAKLQQSRASPGQKTATISELRQFGDKFVLAESSSAAAVKNSVTKPSQLSDAEDVASPAAGVPLLAPTASSSSDPVAERQSSPAASPPAVSTAKTSSSSDSPASAADDGGSTSSSLTPAGSSASSESAATSSTTAAKSKLNPNAKVFTLNPNAKSFTPAASLAAMTPPRATPPAPSVAQYPPLMPVTAATPVPATVAAPGIGYIVTPPIALAHHSQHPHPHHPHSSATGRYPKQRPVSVGSGGGDYGAGGSLVLARGDPASLHVAAVTGQPLLAGHPAATLAPAPGLHEFPPGVAAAPGAGGPVIVRIQAPTTLPMAYQHPAASVPLAGSPYETCQPPPPLPPPHSSSMMAYNMAAQQAAAAGLYQYPAGAPSNMYLLPAAQQLQPFFPAPAQAGPVTMAPQPFILPPQPPPPPSAATPQQQGPPPQPQQQYPTSYPMHPPTQQQLHAVHHGQP